MDLGELRIYEQAFGHGLTGVQSRPQFTWQYPPQAVYLEQTPILCIGHLRQDL